MIIKKFVQLILISSIVFLASCSNQSDSTRPSEGADYKQAAELNVQLAIGYIQRDQLEAAKEKLDKAIKQDEKNLEARKTMAYLLTRLGMNDEADEQYQAAINIKSSDPGLHNSYGAFLCGIGRADEAMEEFKAAYSHPFYETPYLAYANAGTCLLQQGDYVESEAMLRKALRINPTLPGALISMAELGIKTKKYLMSRAYIERYHQRNKTSAQSLWIQVQAEKALGATDYYVKYAKQLIAEFPDSDEAGWAQEQARDEQLRNN
ncbi:MAG: type IV pilus biogenesis/stability protein PilW [Gammaproteobacteria bacterium]